MQTNTGALTQRAVTPANGTASQVCRARRKGRPSVRYLRQDNQALDEHLYESLIKVTPEAGRKRKPSHKCNRGKLLEMTD